MKRTLGVLSIAVTSVLALTGCPSGGGSSNNNNTAVGVGQLNAGSCNIQSNYYTCSQTLNGVAYNTPSISYISTQDLCAKINDNYSNVNKDTRGQLVASEWRQQYATTSCQNIGGGNLPGIPGGNQTGMKTFTCQLSAQTGNMIYDGQPQQIQLSRYLTRQTIPAMAIRTTGNGFWQMQRMVTFAKLNVEYIPTLAANTTSIDQLKMSVSGIDGEISASVMGSASGETRIEIQPKDSEDGQTILIANCVNTDAQTMIAPAIQPMSYQCVGSETADGRTTKINYINQIADVATSGISLSKALFVQGDQGAAVNFIQELPRNNDSVVSLKSKISSATTVSVEKLGYSLKVKCQPK